MGINIFEPNDVIGNNLENGEPRYETFIPYVEFYGIRYNDVEYKITSTGTTYTQGKDNKLINFLGFDPVENLYTTRATSDLDSDDTEFKDEGFGITDIDIDIKSKFVPKVTINFTDIKGVSLFNRRIDPTTKEMVRGDYSILFDFPPPTFVLVMKGVYGKAVRIILHITNYKVNYDANSGNFNINCEFVGKTFAPLSDIQIGWLKTAPYIGDDKKIINNDERLNVNSFYELLLRGDKLYDKINVLVDSSKEKTQIKDNNDLLSRGEELLKEMITFNYKDTKYIRDGSLKQYTKRTISGLNFKIADNKQLNINNGIPGDVNNPEYVNRNYLGLKLPKNPTDEISNIIYAFEQQKKKLIKSSVYTELLGTVNNSDNDILIVQKVDPNNINNIMIYFDYTTYEQKLTDGINKKITEQNVLTNDLQTKINKVVNEELGFKPTIGNIFKVICDDIDIFFNKLKNAGDHNRKDDNISDIKILKSGGFPRVTMIKQETLKQRDGSSIVVDREVAVYPGAKDVLTVNPDFKNWPEVNFVENFINAYFKIKRQEEFEEEIEKLAEDGTKKFIPSNAIELEKFGDSKSLKYTNKLTDDQILLTFFKRYMLQTQYTYKGYWSSSFDEERRKSLVQFLANSEVENLVNSVFDEDLINLLIQLFGNDKVFTKVNFLQSVDNYFTKNPTASETLVETKKFLYNILPYGSSLDFKINDSQSVFPFRDKPSYVGLIELNDFDENNDIIDDTKINNNERPTKYLFDYVNGDTIDKFFQNEGDKPQLTKDNLLFFKDVKSLGDNNGDSDFYIEKGSVSSLTLLEPNPLYQVYYELLTEELKINKTLNETFVKNLIISVLIDDNTIYDFNNLKVIDKFSYPGIISLPKSLLIRTGYKINKGELQYLSIKDKEFFLNYYSKFYNELEIFSKEIIDKFKSSTEEIDIRDYNFYKYINEKKYIMNFTSFTFLNENVGNDIIQEGFNFFYPLMKKDSNGNFIDNVIEFDTNTFGTSNEDLRGDIYYSTFVNGVLPKLKAKLEKEQKKSQELASKLTDDDLKSQIYYDFKKVYDRWIKGTEESPNSDYAYPYSNNTPLIDKFNFIDRAFNDIGDDCIIDFSSLLDSGRSTNSEVYGTMGALLAKNNFEFFPIQNFIDYNRNPEYWSQLFTLEGNALASTSPLFNCMYVGGFSEEIEDEVTFNPNKPSLGVSDIGSKTFCFNVKMGQQNQTIFKDINLNTTENKETNESLTLMDNIYKNLGQNQTPTPKGQNMLDMYENRGYSCEVGVPLGNMLIQPLQYFELYHVPIYSGVYIILEVKHRMSANNNKLSTTFKGTKISRWMKPIVTNPFVDLTNISNVSAKLKGLTKKGNGGYGSENSDDNNLPKNFEIQNINDEDILVRSDSGNKLFVRDTGTLYINDERYLTFTNTLIDTTNVTIRNFKQKLIL